MHDMKPFKTIMLLAAMLLLANNLPAQVDYLKQAHQYLDEGNCDGAQTYYDLYRNNHPADRDLEIAIAVCQAQKEQTERYNKMVAAYEQRLQELRTTDSAQYAGMKAVYEALLSGDCDKAHQEYLEWYAVSGYDDKGMEDRIKQCRQQKTESEKPKATEDVKEVGNLEYYIYLNGTEMAWGFAESAAKQSRVGGHSDWRLPTIAELQVVLQQPLKDYKYANEYHWSSTNSSSSGYKLIWKRGRRDSDYITEMHYCVIVRSKK